MVPFVFPMLYLLFIYHLVFHIHVTLVNYLKRILGKNMFHTLDTFDTEFCADSIEWCPIEPFKDLFVCGTYQLTKNDENRVQQKTKRLGRMYMFRVLNGGQLTLLQHLDVPAILDMKWAHTKWENKILLGVTNSLGHLQIYQFGKTNKDLLELISECSISRDEEETLALSLDWSLGRCSFSSEIKPMIAVSDSKGSISLIEIHEEKLTIIFSCQAHEFEAWIVAFDYWNTNLLYSGGDDCIFQSFDVRCGTQPVSISRVHTAGVTSMHSNATREFMLVTGSYDDTLRLWDTRNFKRPVSQKNLGGGIWCLKWDPFVRRYLLAACMRAGFKAVNCTDADNLIIIDRDITISEEHRAFLIGTCSFYDHALNLSVMSFKDDTRIPNKSG
ncbi:hypothetical protein KM043_016943 [Ampulex compressa]|nr:hypothetical protein KM043_016943 [Ampulex compressa]